MSGSTRHSSAHTCEMRDPKPMAASRIVRARGSATCTAGIADVFSSTTLVISRTFAIKTLSAPVNQHRLKTQLLDQLHPIAARLALQRAHDRLLANLLERQVDRR